MLKISKADYDLIRWEAERSYPHECCGILLGTIAPPPPANTARSGGPGAGQERKVTLTLTCENASTHSPGNRYSIHPEQLIAGLKLARSRGETIVGFYHSHPDHPAQFSTTDLDEAHWFDCSYLIVSVEHGRATTGNSFVLTGTEDSKQFEAEEMVVTAYQRPLQDAV
jgi:proteasome lid subunit RPN8/RPN11